MEILTLKYKKHERKTTTIHTDCKLPFDVGNSRTPVYRYHIIDYFRIVICNVRKKQHIHKQARKAVVKKLQGRKGIDIAYLTATIGYTGPV